MPSAPLPTSDRLHGLDALRGFALLLGVALHAAMSWLPGAQYFWIVSESEPSPALAGLFFWVHLFRMTTFFLLAGFFGRLMCERLGAGAFLRDRVRRIALPLLAFWPLVMSGIVLVVVWKAVLDGGGAGAQPAPPGPAFTPGDFPLTHLWFLYLLSGFYPVAVLLHFLARRAPARLLALADAAMRTACGPWAALLLGLPVAVALFHHEGWYAWFGIPTPDRSLYPNLAALTAYGVAFGVGWLLHRQRELLRRIEQWHLVHLALACAATGLCLGLIGWTSPATPAPADARTALYAYAYGVAGWAWTLALTGIALRHAAGHSPVRRWIADSSYWVYLIHLPVVMALQVAANRLQAPWWLEYPVVLGVALALLLASYALFVRHGALGAWLNGRRRPRGPAAAHANEA